MTLGIEVLPAEIGYKPMATSLFHSFVPSDPFFQVQSFFISVNQLRHIFCVQVVEGSDNGQKPDIDDVTTDSDGPVKTHVSNPP